MQNHIIDLFIIKIVYLCVFYAGDEGGNNHFQKNFTFLSDRAYDFTAFRL